MHVEGSRAIEDDVTINKDRIDDVEATWKWCKKTLERRSRAIGSDASTIETETARKGRSIDNQRKKTPT